jgi:hypothetical protein
MADTIAAELCQHYEPGGLNLARRRRGPEGELARYSHAQTKSPAVRPGGIASISQAGDVALNTDKPRTAKLNSSEALDWVTRADIAIRPVLEN